MDKEDVVYIYNGIILYVCALSHVQLSVNPWIVAARVLCPWNFPGKNTRGHCHFLFLTQGIFLAQICLLHWQADCLPPCHLRSPQRNNTQPYKKEVLPCNNRDGFWRHYARWNKLDREREIPSWSHLHAEFKTNKNRTHRYREQSMVTRGRGGVKGKKGTKISSYKINKSQGWNNVQHGNYTDNTIFESC